MKSNPLTLALSCLKTIVGTALTAAAFGCIVLPQGFAAGGLTGLARILGNVLPLSLTMLVYLLNIPLFAMGWICIGWEFVGKTLAVSLLFPTFLEVFSHVSIPTVGIAGDILIAGLLLGIGSVLILRSNASSGGFDTLAVALNRKWGIPVGWVVRICDCTVILLQTLGQPLRNTIAGILVIFIGTALINRYMAASHSKSPSFQVRLPGIFGHNSVASYQNPKKLENSL